MARLSYKQRKRLPKSSFALPSKREDGKGGYPIPDKAHARNALARVAQHGSPSEKARVRAKVHAKYPSIGKKGGMTHRDPETGAPRHRFEYGLKDSGGGGSPIPGYKGAGRDEPSNAMYKRVSNQSHQAEPGDGEGILSYGESNPGRHQPLDKGPKHHVPLSYGKGVNQEAHSSTGKRWHANKR